MQSLRLFVALNLPDDVKNKLSRELEPIQRLMPGFTRFLAPRNWHLTISFLGNQDADSAARIAECVRRTAGLSFAPVLRFQDLSYGPSNGGGSDNARMIWLNGAPETSRQAGALRDTLEENLIAYGIRFKQENRGFRAHITLARFEPAKCGDLPAIEKKMLIDCAPNTLDLMISRLARSGAEYETAGQFAFKTN